MNLNQLAVEICRREGKKVQVNIGQTKEILKVLIEILSDEYQRTKDGCEIIRDTNSFGNRFDYAVTDKAWIKTAKSKSQQRRLKVQKKAKKK